MSFRSEKQQARVCRALLARVRLGHLFDESGPTPEAVKKLKSGHGSSSEALMLRIAFDVWNGRGEARFDRILHVFDSANMRAVAMLLVAFANDAGGVAIDEWLARFESKPGPTGASASVSCIHCDCSLPSAEAVHACRCAQCGRSVQSQLEWGWGVPLCSEACAEMWDARGGDS